MDCEKKKKEWMRNEIKLERYRQVGIKKYLINLSVL
jgi:hypothetical protein